MYSIKLVTKKVKLHPNVQVIHLDNSGDITKSSSNINWDYYIGIKEFIDEICDDIKGSRIGYYFINHNNQTGGFISDNPEIVIRYLIEEKLCNVID